MVSWILPPIIKTNEPLVNCNPQVYKFNSEKCAAIFFLKYCMQLVTTCTYTPCIGTNSSHNILKRRQETDACWELWHGIVAQVAAKFTEVVCSLCSLLFHCYQALETTVTA